MKQFRKVLALLLSVMMLMTVLPLSAVTGATGTAYDGYFYNGDFEAGTANWTLYNDDGTVTEVIDDPTGSGRGKVMHTNSTSNNDSSLGCDMMFNQTITLEANTDVILKFKVYCYSTATNAAFWVTIGDNTATYSTSAVTGLSAQTVSSSSSTRVRLNVNSNTGKWVDVAIPYNTGSNTSVLFRFDNYRTGAGQYYFDDITIEGPNNVNGGDEPDDPDAPADYNILQNGDFEQGNTGWTNLVSTVGVVADPTGSNRGNVMQTNENGGSVHMFQQGVNISANTDYILTYKLYAYAASGTNPGWWITLGDTSVTYSTSAVISNGIEVKTVSSSSSTRVRFTITNSALYNKWIEVKIPFNSGNNTTPNIMVSNYRADAGQYYFDDFVLVRADGKTEPEPETPDQPDNPDVPIVEGNLVNNGTFESGDLTGWKGYQSTKVNAEAAKTGNYGGCLKGNGSWGTLLQQSVDVAIGKSYAVKMWVKVASVGMNIHIRDGGEGGTLVSEKWCDADGYAEWTQVSFVVAPTTNTLFINLCGAGTGTAEVVYLDDVSVVEAPLISNGDFETGDLSGWEKWQSTALSAEAAYEGSYGVNLKGNGSWGGMLNQNLPVKNGKTYELSFWYKINTSGFVLQLRGVQTETSYMNKTYTSPVGEWTQLTVSVTSVGDTAIVLNFCGTGGSTANPDKAEDVYVDAITFTEMKGASNDGYLLNGDFEYKDWTTHWTNVNNSCTVSLVEGYNSSQALNIIAPKWCQVRQKFSVEKNVDYTITLWAKNTTAITLLLKTGVDDQNYAQYSISAGSTWTQITYDFNSGDNTSLYLGFMGQDSGNGAAVIDDIRIVANKEPTFDGYIYNGDFEIGKLGKWTSTYGSTAISSDAHDGIYAVSVKGPGDWGSGLLSQSITVEAGKTYTLSFWYKPIQNGVNYKLRVKDAATSLDTLYLDSRKYADWTYYEVTFEVGTATEIEVTFSGSGKNTTDEVLVDDVRLVNLSGNEMDRAQLTTGGGASIRDTANGNPALAFRFFLTANGIQVKEGNVYVENTGTLKLYKYAEVLGNLKKFGAVLTNSADIGTDAERFNLDSVNGRNVLNVNAKYLMEWDDTSASYAIRIINIPNAYVGNEIYARPYYTYELDGEEYTIYGDIVHDNYAQVESVRRTKRVLSIGGLYEDTNDHLYNVLKSADYDQVILGHLDGTTYYKNNDNGVWTTTEDVDKATAIADERWQYIVINDITLLEWVNANKPADAQVLYNIDWESDFATDAATAKTAGVAAMPTGTALENLATVHMAGLYDGTQLSDKGDYAASLAWFVNLTGESLELVDHVPTGITKEEEYNLRRAATHAYATPCVVDDLSEVVLVSGSDYQYYGSVQDGLATLKGLTDSLKNQGYGMFDGLLFGGDYTTALGSDYDASNEGLYRLDDAITETVNFDKFYTQGNHDAAGIDLLNPYGNNDPAGAPYGVFIIHEDKFDCYGHGGQQVAADLTAYFNEKLESGWGNKPIFVTSHIPLHFNARTVKDGMGSSAKYVVDALNAASEAGLNIIFLIGHNHGSGYDDYLGGAAVYIPKGETIVVPDHTNYKNKPIETELKFTYMNYGYISSYGTSGTGVDTTLTMCTFHIQENGDVIITRYDKNGVHNLKSAGKVPPTDLDVTDYTFDDERVYESSRIVGAYKDEKYNP